MNAKPFLIIAALLLAGAGAHAHDLVLMPIEQGTLRVRFGHPADWQSVDAEKLLEVQAIDATGKTVDVHTALKRRALDLVAPFKATGPVLTAARYDNGLWLKLPTPAGQPEQFRNASKFMLPEGRDALLAVKFAKGMTLARGDDTLYRQSVGHLLEIVPQKNPLTLARGELLPVLVRFAGKPLADAGIEASDMTRKIAEDKIVRYKTGADGIAQVKLQRGLNILGVDHSVPNDGSLGEAARALPVARGALIATYAFRL